MGQQRIAKHRNFKSATSPVLLDAAHPAHATMESSTAPLHSFAQVAVTPVQSKQRDDVGEAATEAESVSSSSLVATGGGKALPAAVQAKMESTLGADFSDVRIHEGPQASSIGALAYTQGSDIHFQPGQYQPGSSQGQQLLGHELTHVVQQRQGRVRPTMQGLPINDDASLEAEADALGAQAASQSAPVQMKAARQPIQRKGSRSEWKFSDDGQSEETKSDNNNAPDLLDHWGPGKTDTFNDTNLLPNYSKDKIAGGAINQVDLVTYNQNIGSYPSGYFKEDKQEGGAGEAATGIGIGNENMRLANRAVATSRVADQLGTDIVARTEFAEHNGKKGSVSESAPGRPLYYKEDTAATPSQIKSIKSSPSDYLGDKDGMVDDFSEGGGKKKAEFYEKDGQYFKRDGRTVGNHFDFSDPQIQKGMNDLQWNDALTGQVDRHGANIYVDDLHGKVTGIDNDAAFGSKNSDNPDELVQKKFGGILGSHAVGLPSIIDAATAEKYMNLTPDQLQQSLQDVLSPAEIEATIQRLQHIQMHILGLQMEGKVVGGKLNPLDANPEFDQWGTGTFDHEKSNEKGSYLGRSVAHLEELSKQGNAQKPYERTAEVMMSAERAPRKPQLQVPIQDQNPAPANANPPQQQWVGFNKPYPTNPAPNVVTNNPAPTSNLPAPVSNNNNSSSQSSQQWVGFNKPYPTNPAPNVTNPAPNPAPTNNTPAQPPQKQWKGFKKPWE